MLKTIFHLKALSFISLKGPDGRVDKATWKSIQLIMQDTPKFCEHMNNYNWCEGLPQDVLNTVLCSFAPGEEIPMGSRSHSSLIHTRGLSSSSLVSVAKGKIRFQLRSHKKLLEDETIKLTSNFQLYIQLLMLKCC